jgi:peroxiredoxin
MTLTEKIVGSYAPDFELPGIDGEVYHLGRYREQFKAIAVIFLKNQTPQIVKYIDRLKQIQAQFSEQKFTIVAINSNDPDNNPKESFADMKAFATNYQLNFPYLRDTTQDVAKSFGSKFLPEVFLLDRNAVIYCTGQLDARVDSPEVFQNGYLQDNIVNLLAQQSKNMD